MVPDQVAAKFADGLYSSLMEGWPLGQAIVLARRRLIESCSNPLGLVWTFHADPDLRLPVAQRPDQQPTRSSGHTRRACCHLVNVANDFARARVTLIGNRTGSNPREWVGMG